MKNLIKKTSVLVAVFILILSINSCSKDDPITVKLLSFSEITLDDIKKESSNLSNAPIVIVEDSQFEIGTIILYKNNDGNLGKLSIKSIEVNNSKFILTVDAITYSENGSILGQTPNNGISVREGFLFTLGSIIEEIPSLSTEADFRWNQKSAVDADLLPFGEAIFMLYK